MRINELKYKNKNVKTPSKEKYEKFFKKLEKECSEAIGVFKSSNYRMYRGIRGVDKVIFQSKSLSDRKPIDTAKRIQKEIDFLLREKGFDAIRRNSIFVTSNEDQAYEYGEVYFIIPKDGFSFTWSNRTSDLNVTLSDYEDELTDMPYEKMIKKLVSVFKNNLLKSYSNKNLLAALRSENEIMISGKFYAIKKASELYWALDSYLS